MLAPIVRDGKLVGIISVHHAAEPRTWTDEDVAALERAQQAVQAELERG
jgi:GAF domain-containing protein